MQFLYTAKNRDGQIVSDTVEAASREAVGQTLRQRGMLPTSIVRKSGMAFDFNFLKKIVVHVSLLEKLTFIKNLAVTLKAGLPIAKALAVLSRQTTNQYLSEVIGQIGRSVETGKSLSESMGVFPKVFSPIVVNMVRVGESSGDLDKNLDYLAKQISRDYNLIRKTKGALMYPAVVLAALVIIGYLMFTFVLPKLTATFKEFNVQLPVLTKVIIKTVDIFSNYSFLILAAAVGLFALFWSWHKTAGGKAVMHRAALVFPVFGKITKKINLARFTIIFGGLLRSGMPIVEALRTTGETMSNVHYRKAILEASDQVKIGVDLVSSLEKNPELFTPMVTQMIQVGEESGTIELILEEVANFYETEVDDTVKNIASIIEPVLVIIIGGVVGLLAVGLILPIYSITQGV